jgi:hypothetical protein
MKVRFQANKSDEVSYQDLTVGNVYRVIGIEADDFRILNDEGLPYLYPHQLFAIVDDQEPRSWIIEYGDAGERYAYPSELNRVGFFEDYFDGDQEAIMVFHQYLANQRILRNTASKAA